MKAIRLRQLHQNDFALSMSVGFALSFLSVVTETFLYLKPRRRNKMEYEQLNEKDLLDEPVDFEIEEAAFEQMPRCSKCKKMMKQ